MPSKRVYIKCKPPFHHGSITSEAAQEQLAFTKKGIGSFFVNKFSTRKGHGLTDEEVLILLPQILEIQPTDPEFRKKVELFYTEINTLVPYGDRGREFEIGLEIDNDMPITHQEPVMQATAEVDANGVAVMVQQKDKLGNPVIRKNTPINFEDYVRYRHALAHPDTAASPQLAKGNGLIKYYVEDPIKVLEDTSKQKDLADKAILHYNTIKDKPKDVKMILTLLRAEIPRKTGQIIIISNLKPEEQQLKLREIAVRKPELFYDTATDENMKYRYLLNELIRVKLLDRAGQSILINESGDPLGADEKEAINNLFKNPANSQTLNLLKARYEEATRDTQLVK